MAGFFTRRTRRAQIWLRAAILALAVMLLASLVACKEEEKKEEQSAGNTEAAAQVPEVTQKPGIFVGNVQVEFEAPSGFFKVDAAEQVARLAQAGLDANEYLLGLYVLDGATSAADGDPVNSGTPSSTAALRDSDYLLVTTLEKWLYSHFTVESFEEFKAGWQKDSLVCDQQVLSYFAEAAGSRLSDYTAYTYNLGMAGYGREQITFASVSKNTVSDSQARYVCHLKTLLYRQGKIIALSYNRNIASIPELGKTIDDYMDYLREMQAQDSSASGELGSQTVRGIRLAGPEVSMAD